MMRRSLAAIIPGGGSLGDLWSSTSLLSLARGAGLEQCGTIAAGAAAASFAAGAASTSAAPSATRPLPTGAWRSFSSSSSGGAEAAASAPSSSSRDEAAGGSGGSSGGSASIEARRNEAVRSLLAGGKRFYKTVEVKRVAPGDEGGGGSGGGGWQLLLDGRPVRTPARRPLVAPTYALALALAAEWEWLPNGKPVMHAMPLTSLAATALDEPKPRQRVVDDLLKYVHTDAACVRYDPGPLADRQAKAFDPLLEWAAKELGWGQLRASADIAGPSQPPESVEAVRRWLAGLGAWRLAAAEQLTAACKSVVLAAALLHGRVTPGEALAASRLEEDFQIEDWGSVEAAHDLDAADQRTRVAAPAVLARLLEVEDDVGSGGGGGGGSSGSARA